MAYKLNLVTMQIRKRMAEVVKDKKVHNKEKTYISTRDSKDERNNESNKKSKKQKNRYLTINAIKSREIGINAEIDKDALNEETLGIFIDKKK